MKNKIINKIEHYVEDNPPKSRGSKEVYLKHVYKVRDYAIQLVEEESADEFVCELAALLHDVESDEENHAQAGAVNAEKVLIELGLDQETINQISEAVKTHSRGCNPKSLEGRIVQDADGLAFLEVSYKDYFNYFKKEMNDLDGVKKDTISKLKQMKEKIKTNSGNKYADKLYPQALSWIKNRR